MSDDRDDAQGSAGTPSGQQPGDQPDHPGSAGGGDTAATGSTAVGQPSTGAGQHGTQRSDTQRYDTQQFGQPQYGEGQHGQPQYGQAPYGQGQYGQAEYGPPQYGQGQYGQGQYGQPQYGQPQYGQPQYGQYGQADQGQPWGQPQPYGQYGQTPYGQYGQYGGDEQPARPGTVITAAVLALVYGALGLLVTVGLIAGGALIDDFIEAIAESDPSFDDGVAESQLDDIRSVLVLIALLALAWTVLMVWGSVLALRGRSRVPLIVGASISVATTGLVFLFSLIGASSEPGDDTGGVLLLLALFSGAVAMLVLICLRSAEQFFAAHRRQRSLTQR